MLHQVLGRQKGTQWNQLRAGFMEERTLCPGLKHKVEFARGQDRERQRELSRLTTQPMLPPAEAEVTKSQGMFPVVWREETKSGSSKFLKRMTNPHTRRAKSIPLTGPLVPINTGTQYSQNGGGDTRKIMKDYKGPDSKVCRFPGQ